MYVLTDAATGHEFGRFETKAEVNEYVFRESGHEDGQYSYNLRFEA